MKKIPISNPRPGDLDPQKIHSKAISDHNYNYLGLFNFENPKNLKVTYLRFNALKFLRQRVQSLDLQIRSKFSKNKFNYRATV